MKTPLSIRERLLLLAEVLAVFAVIFCFVMAARAAQPVYTHKQYLALQLQYHDENNLVGANILADKAGEDVVYANAFQCRRQAQVFVSQEKDKKTGYACVPIPDGVATRVVPDISGLTTPIIQLAVAFEYGTTHQLVKTVLLGIAPNNDTCVKTGKATLKASKVLPGWVLVIQCIGVPQFPPASSNV